MRSLTAIWLGGVALLITVSVLAPPGLHTFALVAVGGVLILLSVLAFLTLYPRTPETLPDQKRAEESEHRIKVIEQEIADLKARVDMPDKSA